MDRFTIEVLDGWEKIDIPNGIQVSNPGGTVLQIQAFANNISEKENRDALKDLANRYEGTPLEETELLGMKFYRTTYKAYGKEMTFYSGMRHGEQIKIQVSGSSYRNNEDIKQMLESVEFLFY